MKIMQGPPGPETMISGKKYLYFGGTGYYELHNHPEIIKASIDAMKKYGLNSGTTRNGFGTTPLLLALEKKAAAFFSTENAACLASGFLSSMAGLQALQNLMPYDVVFIDSFSHYSNKHASLSTRKPVISFEHLNLEDLERKLKKQLKPGQRPLLVTDGVFPVFGKIAPLPDYLNILSLYNGIVWVDDSHGSGVIGENGRGSIEYHHIQSDHFYMGSTLSKAFGGFGGIIPGNTGFVEEVRKGPVMNGASTAPAPAVAAGLKGLSLLMDHPEMRQKLWQNARRLKSGLKKIGFETEDTSVPIAAWTLKNEDEMKRVQCQLMDRGISIQFTHYIGAGPNGVLRAVVFSTHTEAQIDHLLSELNKLI